jgi:hypothetical protein
MNKNPASQFGLFNPRILAAFTLCSVSVPLRPRQILAFFRHVQSENLVGQFELLVRLAAKWVSEQEQRILREGKPLSENELADAKAVGVRHPERVRALPVEAIPSLPRPILKAAAEQMELPSAPRGLTLQYGIFVRGDCRQDRNLVIHELVHTAQYERFGGIVRFVRQYLFECATLGYGQAPLEQEAVEVAERICGTQSIRDPHGQQERPLIPSYEHLHVSDEL